MTTQTHLPPGLEPWGEALGALHPEFVSGLLPVLHLLDDLIHRRDVGQGDTGLLDGYAGITNRGTPERILISEWLLADEVPMEFLRRASENELMYLAPAHSQPQLRGRCVVLVDNGPAQLGSPRLVQLAALIVLHRRVVARGADMQIGLLSDPPHTWIEGDLAHLLDAWLRRRSSTDADPSQVDQRVDSLDTSDEVWVLASGTLAAKLTNRRRVVQITEGTWSAKGVQELHVDLDGDLMELALPRAELAVRALRGSAFRTVPEGSRTAGLVDLRAPSFNSHSRRLLLRGRGNREVVSANVSENNERTPRVRRHGFAGTVLAASGIGKRLVAVVLEDDEIRIRVIGKALSRVTELVHPLSALGATSAEAESAAEGALPPVYFSGSGVIFGFQGGWWRMSERHCLKLTALALAPGPNLDKPRVATLAEHGLSVDWGRVPDSTAVTSVVFGGGGCVAVSEDGVHWRPFIHRQPKAVIVIEEGCSVLALVVDSGEPKLITLSRAGLIVRLVGTHRVTTLTRWSGGPGRPTIHPSLPLVAVQRADDLVEIGHLLTGELHQVIRSEA